MLSAITLLLLVLYSIFILLNVVFRYWFLTILMMILGFLKLAQLVGTALMFPGAFSYYRGSVEMSYSTEMSQAAHTNLLVIERACDYATNGREEDSANLFPLAEKNVEWIVGVLGKDEKDGLLSPSKARLLRMYRHLN